MTRINPKLASIIELAYRPCAAFSGRCREMRWDPSSGHVPRGFVGAAGSLDEIELVLIVAEPGDPYEGESHEGLATAYDYATRVLEARKDQFHKNVRYIMEACWPQLPFEQQLVKVWITESVLCSAKREGDSVGSAASKECGTRYLMKQLEVLPQALVAALGRKAQQRLDAIGLTNYIRASAVAPPGCNFRGARESWDNVAAKLTAHRQGQRGAPPDAGSAGASPAPAS